MPYIQTKDLTKTFTVRKKKDGHILREKKEVCALDHVSFQVEKGELVGYIGPNGAINKYYENKDSEAPCFAVFLQKTATNYKKALYISHKV